MLNAKHFATGIRRFLALSSMTAIVITTAVSTSRVTRACPAAPPQPLRQLYLQSALVVIARVGKTETTKAETENEVTSLRTALLVSSTLKGDVQPVVYLNHWTYEDYKDVISSTPEGESLLLFLLTREGEEGYFIDDMSYGAKKLSDADLSVYVSRIEELTTLMKAGKPSDTQIVEWLVRCAEEPATRWEGTYELAMSQYALASEQEQAGKGAPAVVEETTENRAVEVSEEDAGPVDVEVPMDSYQSEYPVRAEFAKLIRPDQKYHLATALINGKLVPERDYYLVELVDKWDDPRLVPYLRSQLQNGDQAEPYYTERLMTIVSQKLGDDALIALVKAYSESISMESSEPSYDESENVSGDSANRNEPTADQLEANRAAVVQARVARVQYFVTLAESTIQNNEAEKVADSSATVEP